jgi:predicted ABC-type ATPase
MSSVKRLRIFAGPNGSGKSTMIRVVSDLGVHLGIYVNADEIKIELDRDHFLDFDRYSIVLDVEHLKASLLSSSFYSSNESEDLTGGLIVEKNCLFIDAVVAQDQKFSLFLADYIRLLLVTTCNKFTFETVMSHPSKLEFIRLAKSLGYRIYLYFISLEDPIMNVARVEARVRQGGHDVPTDKIVDRYARTMNLLLDAIKLVDRAYLFDNSSTHPILFATSQHDEISLVNMEYAPDWFQKYVIDKL